MRPASTVLIMQLSNSRGIYPVLCLRYFLRRSGRSGDGRPLFCYFTAPVYGHHYPGGFPVEPRGRGGRCVARVLDYGRGDGGIFLPDP